MEQEELGGLGTGTLPGLSFVALYQGSVLSLSYMSAPETVGTVGLTE